MACTNALIPVAVEYFSLAFTVTLFFVFLEFPPVKEWFETYIPGPTYRFLTKALLFFTIVLIIDRLIVYLRNDIDLCEFPLW